MHFRLIERAQRPISTWNNRFLGLWDRMIVCINISMGDMAKRFCLVCVSFTTMATLSADLTQSDSASSAKVRTHDYSSKYSGRG